MIKEGQPNTDELEFRRDENKFFVPPTFAEQAVEEIDNICVSQGCEKEHHEHPITRSAYYYFDDTDSMPPGFSVRYREYVDKTIDDGSVIGESQSGFYEIKWLDQYESGRPIKHKLRLQGDYANNITLENLKKMMMEINEDGKIGDDILDSLNLHLSSISREANKPLQPLFIAEYKRNRYINNSRDNKNVVSVDQDVNFYEVCSDGSNKKLGNIEGCIVEYKESVSNTSLRWQLYRALTSNNAIRFYGKKGEALNLLQRDRSKNAPPIRDELEGYEIEGKLNILTDLQEASRLVRDLYQYFDESDDDFTITPGFGSVNSQSTMGTYLYDPKNPNIEGKILVGLEAKFSIKKASDQNGDILIRHEEKNTRFEYHRQKTRDAMMGMKPAGKTQRIRRAFYLSSKKTNRVYKLSIDFNWKLPIQDDDFFSQLEVEYTGIPIRQFKTTAESGSPTFKEIEVETQELTDKIKNHLVAINIPFATGQRKVDIV